MMRFPTMFLAVVGMAIGCVNESIAPPVASQAVPTQKNDGTQQVEAPADENAAAEDTDVTEDAPTEFNKLTEFEEYVILARGTERAYVGEYTDTEAPGTYICRRCNAQLYRSEHKFQSDCGWPAFDDEIKGAVDRHRDADGFRVEIVCHNCQGHLGHVFEGEQLTSKNTRHCVNSVSMIFVPKGEKIPPAVKQTASGE